MYYNSNALYEAKDYTLRGYDLTNDQYEAIMECCKYCSSWDDNGKLARDILYTLRDNGWRQLRYVTPYYRKTNDEEYYASQGYRIYY